MKHPNPIEAFDEVSAAYELHLTQCTVCRPMGTDRCHEGDRLRSQVLALFRLAQAYTD